jgi:hypothetical protein
VHFNTLVILATHFSNTSNIKLSKYFLLQINTIFLLVLKQQLPTTFNYHSTKIYKKFNDHIAPTSHAHTCSNVTLLIIGMLFNLQVYSFMSQAQFNDEGTEKKQLLHLLHTSSRSSAYFLQSRGDYPLSSNGG